MCVDHDMDVPGAAQPDDLSRDVSRRGLLRAAAFGAAAVGVTGALPTPAGADDSRGDGGPHRVPVDRISVRALRAARPAGDQPRRDAGRAHRHRLPAGRHASFVGPDDHRRGALDAAGPRATSGHVGVRQPFDRAPGPPRCATPSPCVPATWCARSSVSTSAQARWYRTGDLGRLRPRPGIGRADGARRRPTARLPPDPRAARFSS